MSGNGKSPGRPPAIRTLAAEPPALLGTVLYLEETLLETVSGAVRVHRFENLGSRTPIVAITLGDVRSRAPLLTRIHSSCVTSEGLGGRDCDCVEQLDAALEEITREGRGVLFYLPQEGRGAGFAAKARDRMIVQASHHRLTTFEAYEQMGLDRDLRRYDEVGFVCRLLGVDAPLVLLTNNPEKAAVVADKLPVAGTKRLESSSSPFNVHYIAAKSRSGHDLGDAEAPRAIDLPEEVGVFEPYALPGSERFIHLASYLLPIGLDRASRAADGGAVHWFRVHAYVDVVGRCQRIVLSHGETDRVTPLVSIHEEDLFDRFPLRVPTPSRRRWRVSLDAIVRHGSGCIVFVNADGEPGSARNPELSALLARHVPGRAHPILDRRKSGAVFCDALMSHDVAIERRVLLDEA
jgi:3,4-dihydroxy 2-butanone 4-phosphate synthase / GTP cyclohydrolase II